MISARRTRQQTGFDALNPGGSLCNGKPPWPLISLLAQPKFYTSGFSKRSRNNLLRSRIASLTLALQRSKLVFASEPSRTRGALIYLGQELHKLS